MARGGSRTDPPADKFDPAEFDTPPDPPPSPAGRARGAADAAQAQSFFSNIQRILTGFGTLRDLVSDVRASLADAAARDAQRAEDEKARDKRSEERRVGKECVSTFGSRW